jgi:hypothetical protein
LIFLVLSSTRWRTPLLHVPLIWPLPPSIAITLNKLCRRSLEVLCGRDRIVVLFISSKDFLLFASTRIHPQFLVGSVLIIFLVFCVVLLCVFAFWVPSCDVRYNFHTKKTMFGSWFPASCL